jgi:hypothetical protein
MANHDRLLRQLADVETKKIARKTIRSLQSLKGDNLLSGDDSELANTWDEFCVQVQEGESFFWDAYVITIKQAILVGVVALPVHVKQAIWLQTDDGFEWSLDDENGELDFHPDNNTIVDYVFQEVLTPLAMEWSNSRIRSYCERVNRRD